MLAFLRRLTLALTAVAFLSGATVQVLPQSSEAMMALAAAASGPMADCDQMAMQHPAPGRPMPCKTVTTDCLKMSCIGSPSLPVRAALVAAPVEYGQVVYAATSRGRPGISIEPDLLPPIAA